MARSDQLPRDGSATIAGVPSERERFEAFFRQHSRALLGYALRRVERPEDAADVLSDVMLVAWRRLDDVPGGSEARLWLYGVARGVLRNQRRASRRRGNLGERLRQELARATEQDFAGDWGERQAVRAALRRLPERDREILLLTAWEGLSPTEIATMLTIPPATARTRLHRALARLERELGPPGAAANDGTASDQATLMVRYAEEES